MDDRRALEQLRDADGALTVVPTSDGHVKWQLAGADGAVIAESPPVFRDATLCRAAFADARRSARAALGETPPLADRFGFAATARALGLHLNWR